MTIPGRSKHLPALRSTHLQSTRGPIKITLQYGILTLRSTSTSIEVAVPDWGLRVDYHAIVFKFFYGFISTRVPRGTYYFHCRLITTVELFVYLYQAHATVPRSVHTPMLGVSNQPRCETYATTCIIQTANNAAPIWPHLLSLMLYLTQALRAKPRPFLFHPSSPQDLKSAGSRSPMADV